MEFALIDRIRRRVAARDDAAADAIDQGEFHGGAPGCVLSRGARR